MIDITTKERVKELEPVYFTFRDVRTGREYEIGFRQYEYYEGEQKYIVYPRFDDEIEREKCIILYLKSKGFQTYSKIKFGAPYFTTKGIAYDFEGIR